MRVIYIPATDQIYLIAMIDGHSYMFNDEEMTKGRLTPIIIKQFRWIDLGALA